MAFMDQVVQFSSTERGGPAAFLAWWDENRDKFSLTVNESQDAIRVMTIHKSKGLQFRVVIVPFCDWSLDHDSRKNNILWCGTTGEPFHMLEKVPVRYSSGLAETAFAPDYFHEKQKAYIDHLNLLYVALTRAEQGLIVFAPFAESKNGLKTAGELMAHFANDFLANNSVEDIQVTENPFGSEGLSIEWGGAVAERAEEKASAGESASLGFTDYPFYPFTGRLAVTYQGEGFFERAEEAGNRGQARGRVMHELFSLIYTKDDVEKATDLLIGQGKLPGANREAIIRRVKEIIQEPAVAEWFDKVWKVFNEWDILIPGKGIKRPDRVMAKDKRAVVVDYKFGTGEDKKYDRQIEEYCNLLKEMGYEGVTGYVWYVEGNKINRVV
jgi:ATP-dependent exoDNAse (exonuclease V) beta subunit